MISCSALDAFGTQLWIPWLDVEKIYLSLISWLCLLAAVKRSSLCKRVRDTLSERRLRPIGVEGEKNWRLGFAGLRRSWYT